jgi:hypothetical protein
MPYIVGYAAVTDVPFAAKNGELVIVNPGAFARSCAEIRAGQRSIELRLGHHGRAVADTGDRSLCLREDGYGLFIVAGVSDPEFLANATGRVLGMSIMFSSANCGGLIECRHEGVLKFARTINSVELIEVAIAPGGVGCNPAAVAILTSEHWLHAPNESDRLAFSASFTPGNRWHTLMKLDRIAKANHGGPRVGG